MRAYAGVSWLWSQVNALARHALSWGLIRPTRLPCRVISVGNIQAGGAGKTPLVALIAREAIERKLRVAILCRGYRGSWSARGGILLPRSASPSPEECGDEAALLHELVPEAFIGVGADRASQFFRLQESVAQPFELVILDDGFQHFRLMKDLEIVALTSLKRSEAFFREKDSALENADLLVWTKGENLPVQLEKPCVKVRARLARPAGDARIFLVTGVAHPGEVRKSAEQAGYQVEAHRIFPDHASYSKAQAQELIQESRAKKARLALTGKDWVKWRELGGVERSDIIVLEPELVFEEGRETWNQILWGY